MTNLHQSHDECIKAIEQCKSRIDLGLNKIVSVNAFVNEDTIFVAAVTKWAIYKTHLFAIQYTKIASDSNFYHQLCTEFNNFEENNEKYFKTELTKIISDTIWKESDALKKYNNFQIHTPNVEEILKNSYINMRKNESDKGFLETFLEGISEAFNESAPRHIIVQADKGFPPYIIKRGNQSRWTKSELQQKFLNLCRENGIVAFTNNDHHFPDNISLKIPNLTLDNKTLEISHQNYICMHIWEADFFVIIKEHLYSEGYHLEEETRTVTKKEITYNGKTNVYVKNVIDIYKYEEVNIDHIFIGAVYLVDNTASTCTLYKAALNNTLHQSVQSLFLFFRDREFNSQFSSNRSLLIKYVPHNNLQGKNLDQIFPIGSIACPKMGRFYHPGAIYLGKGQVGHAPFWRDEQFTFKIQDLLEYMGPINELMEVRWRFRPYSNTEILTKSREMERDQSNLLRLQS